MQSREPIFDSQLSPQGFDTGCCVGTNAGEFLCEIRFRWVRRAALFAPTESRNHSRSPQDSDGCSLVNSVCPGNPVPIAYQDGKNPPMRYRVIAVIPTHDK